MCRDFYRNRFIVDAEEDEEDFEDENKKVKNFLENGSKNLIFGF